MKTKAILLALAILAGGVITYRAAAGPRVKIPQVEEPCAGLSCWPPSAPVKHMRRQRVTLPPVW
jgi:hypothetical protein